MFREHLIGLNHGETLTQEQAAHLIGVSRVTWNRWENGKTHPPAFLLKTLRAIVLAYDKQRQGQ
jgi:DNA-binding XRE family transcriptional regulator